MSRREDVRFASGDADCAAWLYRAGDGAPLVILGHGLGAVKEMRLDAFAERFQAAGFSALAFDYRHFGDSGGRPRQLLDIKRQLADWEAALRYGRTLSDRVAIWGSSFGGGHVLEIAARDHGVAAVVSQCPHTDGLAALGAVAPPVAARITARAVRDDLAALAGRGPITIPTVGPPGSVALMTTEDALPGVEKLTAGLDVEQEVGARIASRIVFYRPGRALRRVKAPVLMCVCEHDSVAPAKATLRHAERGNDVDVRRYPIGHFEIYWGEWFERAVADQTEFLGRHL
jgi:pimeloyl-ACP methyl ester carboxylesterase